MRSWPGKLQTFCVCRFDYECRVQVAENLEKRGVHVHPETSPTKCVSQLPSFEPDSNLPADPKTAIAWGIAVCHASRPRING